jgi:hypothetical protein
VVLAWFAAHVRVDGYVRAGAAQQSSPLNTAPPGRAEAHSQRPPNDAVRTRGLSLTRPYQRPTRAVSDLVKHEFQPHSEDWDTTVSAGPRPVDSRTALASSVLNYGEPGNVLAA